MPLSLTTKSTCPKLCLNFVPSFNSENLLKKEVGQFISGPKDKRYKRGIRVGHPLKTERNYATVRTDPPHSGPINPESGPRAGGATAPILHVRTTLNFFRWKSKAMALRKSSSSSTTRIVISLGDFIVVLSTGKRFGYSGSTKHFAA